MSPLVPEECAETNRDFSGQGAVGFGHTTLDYGSSWARIGHSQMAIYAVIQTRQSSKLAEEIRKQTHLEVANGVWLVSFSGTANDLSVVLGIDSGAAGGAIVLKVSTYSGRTLPSTWDWIGTHWD